MKFVLTRRLLLIMDRVGSLCTNIVKKFFGLLLKVVINPIKSSQNRQLFSAINGTQENCLIDPSFYWLILTVTYIKVYTFGKEMSHKIYFWYQISSKMVIFWENHKNHFFFVSKFLWQANKNIFELTLKWSRYSVVNGGPYGPYLRKILSRMNLAVKCRPLIK